MTTFKAELSPQHAQELSVDLLHQKAVARFEKTHEALEALPADPSGKKAPTLIERKQALGLPTSDAEILTAMLTHGVAASVGAAFGAVAGVTVQAANVAMEYRESRINSVQGGTSVPTAPKQESGNRPAIKRQSAAPQFATNIMRKSITQSQNRAYQASLKKRHALERQLRELGDMIMELHAHKESGTQEVMMTPDGKEIKGLYKKRFVFKVDEQRFEQRQSRAQKYGRDNRMTRQYARPKPPAPGMAAFG